jgi:HSP20 family protein
VHWQEIPFGRFERRVPLPTVVRKDMAKAKFRNGVLEIVLPKVARPASRSIQVNVG